MIGDLIAAINIHIDPELISGGFTLTWHGLFTAIGIAGGVWLCLRLARGQGYTADDVYSIALVAVPSGIVGARALWVFEHTDQIDSVRDVFAVTDGGISIYGAVIGGFLGAYLYVLFFRPGFRKLPVFDIGASGMLLGQAIGRFGDLINGEHFARATSLPWAFRYTHPNTDGPWAQFVEGEALPSWFRGQTGRLGEAPVAVHPVAGLYEPILLFLILGVMLYLQRRRLLPGSAFVFYVVSYATVRGLLAILRSDEQILAGPLDVPQFIAIGSGLAGIAFAWYFWRHPTRYGTATLSPPQSPAGRRGRPGGAEPRGIPGPKKVRIRRGGWRR